MRFSGLSRFRHLTPRNFPHSFYKICLKKKLVETTKGHTATIDMIDQIPYLAQSSGQSGNMQVFKEIVGIRLEILPTVNSDGYITTEVTPEVSSIVDWTGQGYPWTKKRRSTTTVRVKDGESIIIAGLVTTESIASLLSNKVSTTDL